jgi:small conductance mechanosensitive channel
LTGVQVHYQLLFGNCQMHPIFAYFSAMQAIDSYWEQIVFALIVLIVAFITTRILRFIVGRFFRRAAMKLKVDPTRYNFFKNAIDFLVFLIAIIVIFRSIPALSILAAIVGFASQSAFSNIVSGVFLVIFKPFSVGDRVKIGQLYQGDVEDITLRHTVIKDFENRRIVIPNSIISNETIINANLIEDKVCMFIEMGIALDTDVEKAMIIIQEEAMKHRHYIDNRTDAERARGDHPVSVRIMGFTELATQLRAYIWAPNASDGFDLKTDLHLAIKKRFDKEGIEIPYPRRIIVNKI